MMSREGDIPAGFGGLIQEPHCNDVLSGRGGRINAHPGNVKFRELVKEYRPVYLSNETKKLDKVKIASRIVKIIRSLDPPGRFLKEENKAWVEIGDEKARKKAGQAMREKAEDFRKEQQQQQQQPHGNLVNSPQQILSGYASTSPNATSPTSAPYVTPNTDPYLQMNTSYQQSTYPQNLMTMPPLQQMNFQHIPSGHQHQYGNMEIPPAPSSNDSSKKNPGLLTGNAVAFNREFNRMSSSESGNAPNSINVSSMGSINTSMSSANRSSLSSRSSGREAKVQIMEPIHDDVEVEESIASAWDDSWDQGPSLKDSESVKSIESERRKNMFRNMKNESSTLPSPNLAVSDNIRGLNENELMKESLVSVEMQSVEMKKSVNFLDNKSMQMDSINELIVDTLNSDEEIKSENFSMSSNDRKNMMMAQAGVNQVGMVLEKANHTVRGVSGVSTASGLSSTSEAQSWAAIENNHSTLPDLPVGLTDSNRQQQFISDNVNRHTNISEEDNRGRIFSDYSNKSTSMMSEISMSMGNLNIDLGDDDDNEY